MHRIIFPRGLVLLCLVSALGCEGRTPPPATHPVRGKVLLDGQPLTAGAVEFRAVDGGALTTLADIQADGAFALSILPEGRRVPGAVAGEYRVTVLFAAKHESQKRAPIVVEKTVTVTAGENVITVEASSPP